MGSGSPGWGFVEMTAEYDKALEQRAPKNWLLGSRRQAYKRSFNHKSPLSQPPFEPWPEPYAAGSLAKLKLFFKAS
jgi:hypothetical protein